MSFCTKMLYPRNMRFSALIVLLFVWPYAQADSVEQVFGSGWTCSLVPNSIYGPGAIYEINGAGQKKFVTDSSVEPGFKIKHGIATVGKITETRELGSDIKLSLLEKLLKGAKAVLSGEVSSSSHSTIEYEIEDYVVTPAQSVVVARNWMRKNIIPDPGKRYFLVRDAITVKSVRYYVDQGLVGKLGGEAPIKKVLDARITLVKGTSESSYTLLQRLNPALWACSSVDELKPEASIVGEIHWVAERTIQVRSDHDDLQMR